MQKTEKWAVGFSLVTDSIEHRFLCDVIQFGKTEKKQE